MDGQTAAAAANDTRGMLTGTGLGLRSAHIDQVLANNHTAAGGLVPRQLAAVRANYPILNILESHGVQNAFVESFNGKFRDQRLNLYWSRDLVDAKRTIEEWRVHYNEVRSHRSPGGQPPSVFARKAA